jgi:amino acid adenylation domain-containing protein
MTEPTVGSEAGAATVAGLLRARAAERPEQVAFTFLVDGEAEGGSLTYGELDRRARGVAAALASAVRPGDRALLLYPQGLDFIAAFFGCLYAGVVAVPAYPPRPNDRSQSRLRAIAHDATPRAALTTEAILAGAVEPRGLLAVAPELTGLRWIPTDALGAPGGGAFPAEPDPESVAFLQYTSGSTAAPKGVMVTHANLLHNERMIGAAFGMDEDSVVVGWLPLYHDMGLIGNVLQPIHAGGRCVLMSPVAFLQRPMRWLEAIDRYRATTSGGPNFAYELCARKAGATLGGLDLSSWRVAYNGAEPVRASTLERFAATFAPSGFRREAFYPCYGLAEATLFVSGGHGGKTEQERVSCGRVGMGQWLVVVEPESGAERPVGTEGEIWISGPSVARGYWENPEATALDFNAFLATGEGPFLRTGDLGFLAGGELYVSGRLKDLIILRGRNLYPQDVEATAERAHPDLLPGGGAAFAVETGGEERLVVVHEVARHRKGEIGEIAEAVRRAVAAEHEAQVQDVVLIRQAGLPKTSSGKVQRRRCRELYLAGELPVVGRSALSSADPAPEIAAALTPEALAGLEPGARREILAAYLGERAAAALGVPAAAVGLDQPLTGLGLDSLSAIELKGAVESALGLALPLADLLQGASARDLAAASLAGSLAQAGEALPPLRAFAGTGDGALSAGQRGLWFLHRLAPEGGAYNIAVAARTRGLDAAAFARALGALAARHEALRTVFPVIGEEPVQRVLPALAPDVRIEPAGEDLERRLAAEAWRPFDLERGPLLRARIYQGADGETLLLVVHHIVADFASLAVVARELAALYRGEELAPPPPLRYADFVLWQAEALAGARGERLLTYWRRRLDGVRDLDLPADHPRPPVQTWRGDARAATLPPGLAAALGALAARRGATPFMALLAAFQAQLARTSGQEDFAVGAALAGRPVPELAGVVGYFVNLLPLRADLAGEPGFGALLDRARTAALEGMEHGDLPFPRIAERLRPQRDPARPPVFQAMLVFQQGRPGDEPGLAAFSLGEGGTRIALGGLELESVRLAERRAQLDLSLFAAADGEGGVRLALEFNADLFDGGTAERMLGHLRTLVEGALAAPDASFWHLPLLSDSERGQFFATWDDTARRYPQGPRGLLLHQLFEAQAGRTPEAEAVVAGKARLTYGELNARANRLAHRLRRSGVRPEDRVGVCLRRSERMIVALFAVLKAGGAYVPLDPAYPRERLKGILDDSAARVVLGEAATAPRLAEESGERWLAVDEDFGEESAENPAPVAIPSNLAYLIYTSGSTGRPKAVAIEHRSPVGLMHWSRELFPPEELAGTLAATSIGFDVSVFEIFAPLSWGGRIFVVENLLAFPTLAAAPEVKLVCGAPSVVAELVRAGRFPAWVRTVNLGGEAVPPALVEGLAAAAPGARIVNAYGPSEDTTYTATALLEPGEPVAIGRPVADTRIYLLDAHGEPVPAGVPGELYIAGAGLSRGYLGRPGLTAEKFVPHPFSTDPGARLYRVGDLARRRPDGVLEYLGRLDHQVKIRGFRVELGEIEAALARHPRLREAVVIAREDGDRGQQLTAYVVPAGVPAAELRGFLRESLPEHMIPAAFVGLDALPLSPNGKVDRRALPDPSGPGEAVTAAAAAVFRTPVEEMIAGVVAEVLGVESVGPTDDFFALGGHSLLATRLLARVSRLFGVDLPVSSVFLNPTVAALAERIAAAAHGEGATARCPSPSPSAASGSSTA